MNQLQIINGVECYEKNGVAYLNLETVARGLGFTKTDVKISESGFRKEYVRIDWPRIRKHLKEVGFHTGDEIPDYIPENIFYRLAMKAKSATAMQFQALVADEIIPSLRKNGGYIVGQENMTERELLASAFLLSQRIAEERAARIEELEAETQAQAEQLAITEPKAEYYDAFVDARTSTNFRTTAKEIGVGERKLIGLLIDKGFLFRDKQGELLPYSARNRGFFIVRDVATGRWMGKQTFVTEKGKQHFRRLCYKEGLISSDQELTVTAQPTDTYLM